MLIEKILNIFISLGLIDNKNNLTSFLGNDLN